MDSNCDGADDPLSCPWLGEAEFAEKICETGPDLALAEVRQCETWCSPHSYVTILNRGDTFEGSVRVQVFTAYGAIDEATDEAMAWANVIELILAAGAKSQPLFVGDLGGWDLARVRITADDDCAGGDTIDFLPVVLDCPIGF